MAVEVGHDERKTLVVANEMQEVGIGDTPDSKVRLIKPAKQIDIVIVIVVALQIKSVYDSQDHYRIASPRNKEEAEMVQPGY